MWFFSNFPLKDDWNTSLLEGIWPQLFGNFSILINSEILWAKGRISNDKIQMGNCLLFVFEKDAF